MLRLFGADRCFVRGEGTHLFDASGREFLDCWAQYGVLALGHNPPSVVGALREAFTRGEPAFLQPYRAPHAEELAEQLVRRAPAGIAHCLFTNSGAETVETALKLSRVATGKTTVLSAEGSYHGSTFGAMGATGQPEYREGFGPLPGGFDTVPYGDAAALEAKFVQGRGQIAAFIVEPIQGQRGGHAPPTGYLSKVRELCTQHDVMLIVDEVQTGLGRTGTLFACEQERVSPDLLLVAKPLGGGIFPIGACLISERHWRHDFGFRHLSTFSNNNLACRAGLAALTEIDALLPKLPAKGKHLASALEGLARRHPNSVRETRSRGFLAALDVKLSSAHDGVRLFSFLQQHGLLATAVAAVVAETASVLVLPAVGSANVIRFLPALTMTESELDRGVEGLDRALTILERGSPEEFLRSLGLPLGPDAFVEMAASMLFPPTAASAG
jgi:acetylornithine/succinyldiaminopimelate/putrescine aminotransferase